MPDPIAVDPQKIPAENTLVPVAPPIPVSPIPPADASSWKIAVETPPHPSTTRFLRNQALGRAVQIAIYFFVILAALIGLYLIGRGVMEER